MIVSFALVLTCSSASTSIRKITTDATTFVAQLVVIARCPVNAASDRRLSSERFFLLSFQSCVLSFLHRCAISSGLGFFSLSLREPDLSATKSLPEEA